MNLVVDAGPIIALSKTGHLDLLPRLFDEVIVPVAVLDEVSGAGETRPGAEIRRQPWITTREADPIGRLELQKNADIAAGEADAILIAALDPDKSILLIDDRRARQAATARGLRVLRTGALWVTAVRRGQLGADDVERAMDTLLRERYLDRQAAADIVVLLRRV